MQPVEGMNVTVDEDGIVTVIYEGVGDGLLISQPDLADKIIRRAIAEICDDCNEPVVEPGQGTICGSCKVEIEKGIRHGED